MKISRVKIYCKLKYIFFSLFINSAHAASVIKNKLSDQTKKKYVQFFGMCRTCFIVVLEYLIKYRPEKKEILICSYNLEEMIEIAKIYKFKVKLIDIDLKTGAMDLDIIEQNISNETAAILYTNMFNNYPELNKLKKICEKNKIISIEDNAISGGAGSAINEVLQKNSIKTPLHILGVPDFVTEHGSQNELYELYGLNAKHIIKVGSS